jgi:hypothetical protein
MRFVGTEGLQVSPPPSDKEGQLSSNYFQISTFFEEDNGAIVYDNILEFKNKVASHQFWHEFLMAKGGLDRPGAHSSCATGKNGANLYAWGFGSRGVPFTG